MKTRSKRKLSKEGLVLATLFFKLIDEANDQTINSVVPWLARVLQEFDFALGFGEPASTPFAAAIDARLLYVLFKNLRTRSAAERRRLCREFANDGLDEEQFKAVEEACLRLRKDEAFRVRPLAAMPIYRLNPDYQSKKSVDKVKEAFMEPAPTNAAAAEQA